MSRAHSRMPLCTIVPGRVLRKLSEQGIEAQKTAAMRTLLQTKRLRAHRQALRTIAAIAALPKAKAREVNALVEQARFFELPERSPDALRGADRFSYLVTVQSECQTHTVRTTDGRVPPTLRPLIDYLVKEGRNRRRQKRYR